MYTKFGLKSVATLTFGISLLVCGGALLFANGSAEKSGTSAKPVTVNISLPNNPISRGLDKLAPKYYKAKGVTVNITVLPENDLRQKLETEASTGGTTDSIFVIGPNAVQYWAKDGWLQNLHSYFQALSPAEKKSYDRADLIPAMINSLSVKGDAYALPFYGETSFTMYNKKLFAAKGLTMPDHPTWTQIYQLASKINDPSKGILGIVMRGEPGWGMSGAPFDTMVNAYGGRWFNDKWQATVDTPQQRAAWKMYKNLLVNYGESNIISTGYNECLQLFESGKVGIYYDATSLAPPLYGNGSKIAGDVGYAYAPHEVKHNDGWLWNWALGLNPKISSAQKKAAFNFMLWATSKQYVKLTLKEDPSGALTPPASRESTYKIPAYAKLPYASWTLKALQAVDFNHPTLKPVPYAGIQYIAIPEFPNIGTEMTQNLADYVVGKLTLDQAIAKTQKEFNQMAKQDSYQNQS